MINKNKPYKENIDVIFICYSQIHLLISQRIANQLAYKKVFYILSKNLNTTNLKGNIIFFEYASFDKNLISKIKHWLKLVFNAPRFYNVSNIYIPNDSDPFVGFLVSKCTYKDIHYIDEGNLALTLCRNSKGKIQLKNSISSKLLSKFYNFPLSNFLLEKNSFKSYWIYFPEIVKKYRKIEGEIYDLKSFFKKTKTTNLITEKNYKDIYAVILGSPLTENKYLKNYEEILVIEAYLNDELKLNKKKKILIKPHYRENKEKYRLLIQKYRNIELICDYDNSIPYQVLHQKINPSIVIGFYSSAMLVENCKVISLIRKVSKSREIIGLIEGIQLMQSSGFDIIY